jgi:thioredoxin-disulfide reductase
MYDLAIIGAGPAGLTASLYGARQKISILLLTKEFGGQVSRKAVAIQNYPGFKEISGGDLIKKFRQQLDLENSVNKRIDIRISEVKTVKKIGSNFSILTADGKNFSAKAVIIASGAQPRHLNVAGEKKFIGRGVSYCAVCDGPVFEKKKVAVVGGGNAGFESAVFLSNYVKEIYILEYQPEVSADKINQEIVQKSGKAKIITDVVLKEIKGDNFVDSIVYQEKESGRETTLKVEGVFVEIGTEPAVDFVKELVDFNNQGEIKIAFETCRTKTPGLFAAGDVNAGRFKQIITACGEGAKAALAAYQYIKNTN